MLRIGYGRPCTEETQYQPQQQTAYCIAISVAYGNCGDMGLIISPIVYRKKASKPPANKNE
jgi:hypothetical protein